MKCTQSERCTRKAQIAGLCIPHYEFTMRGKPRGLVNTAPVIAHIQAFADRGIGRTRLAELTGLPPNVFWRIKQQNKMYASTAAKIMAIPVPEVAHELAADGGLVDLTGTQRRLRALAAIGYRCEDIAAAMGGNATKFGVEELMAGRGSGRERLSVTAGFAKRVAEAFDRLQLTQGESKISRNRALRKGWQPPLAWDEDSIDDPAAEPVFDRERVNFADQIADHRALDRTDDEIATRMGVTLDTLQLRLRRHGLPMGRRYRDIEERQSLILDNPMSKRALKIA